MQLHTHRYYLFVACGTGAQRYYLSLVYKIKRQVFHFPLCIIIFILTIPLELRTLGEVPYAQGFVFFSKWLFTKVLCSNSKPLYVAHVFEFQNVCV